jgi:hypothetical protein
MSKPYEHVVLPTAPKASAVALIALVLVGSARADTIKDFVLSGTAVNVSGGTLDSCADRG